MIRSRIANVFAETRLGRQWRTRHLHYDVRAGLHNFIEPPRCAKLDPDADGIERSDYGKLSLRI